jgi:hypothetical protein
MGVTEDMLGEIERLKNENELLKEQCKSLGKIQQKNSEYIMKLESTVIKLKYAAQN